MSKIIQEIYVQLMYIIHGGDDLEVINQIKHSIFFIERNLQNDITLSDIAKQVYMSSFNFHRTFKILTDITPMEYIRNRRLSNAAEELLNSDKTVLDIAISYTYDTLEGFSKAFSRFHGVSPIKVRNEKVKVRTYHPLKINISFEGGKGMEYKVVSLEPFTLLGKSKMFKVDAEVNLIPEFWDDELEKGLLKELSSYSIEDGVYGACFVENVDSNEFAYSISTKVKNGINVEGLETTTIDHPLWAVFECKSGEHIAQVWDYIIKEFLVNTDYERVEVLDFEYYNDSKLDHFCDLYIPIRKVN